MPIVPVCMAPDPNTRTPKYKPPPGACDAHCHIFGPGDKYPYAPDRSYTPPDAPLAKLRALQKTLGLSRAVLVNASCHGTDNAVILDAIEQSGGRYRLQFFVQCQNITNARNYQGYSGVLTSPFFGQPTTVSGMRKIDAGMNLNF